MSDSQLVRLKPSITDVTSSEFDSCGALRSLLATNNQCELQLGLHDARCTFVTLDTPTAEKSSTTSNSYSVFITLASQSLTLRKVVQVLSDLLLCNASLIIKENRFAKQFATQAIDVYSDQAITLDTKRIHEVAVQYHTDIFVKGRASLSKPGLLVMDMDSTIIAMECIDEIAEVAGVKAHVAEVTERAMRGEIPFTQSLHDRVACLEGVALSELLSIRNRIPFVSNFMATMTTLKAAGWKLAVASGGFTLFAEHVKQLAGLDFAYSNRLEVIDDKLTGKVIGKIVDGHEKASVLLSLAEKLRISQSQTVAMGDGANDLIMMEKAGTSIAYHAKPSVSAAATSAVRYGGFEGLVFTLR